MQLYRQLGQEEKQHWSSLGQRLNTGTSTWIWNRALVRIQSWVFLMERTSPRLAPGDTRGHGEPQAGSGCTQGRVLVLLCRKRTISKDSLHWQRFPHHSKTVRSDAAFMILSCNYASRSEVFYQTFYFSIIGYKAINVIFPREIFCRDGTLNPSPQDIDPLLIQDENTPLILHSSIDQARSIPARYSGY